MSFLDKAKKMAEQAQTKLDEVQKQFNEGQAGGSTASSGPAVEYDKHGRPIRSEEPAASAPPPAPPAPAAPPQAAAPAAPAPPAEPLDRTPPHGDPVGEAAEPPAEDRNHPSYAPPKLSSGDPLAG
jgi:hypothetical protein